MLNMSETAKTLKINRTTLLRLLHTLEARRFCRAAAERRRIIRSGLSLLEVGARAVFSQDLVQVAVPVLTRLADDLAAVRASRDAGRHRRALSRAAHAQYAAREQHPRRQPAAGARHHHGADDARLSDPRSRSRALCRQGVAAFQRAHASTLPALWRKAQAGPDRRHCLERGAFRARHRLRSGTGFRFCWHAGWGPSMSPDRSPLSPRRERSTSTMSCVRPARRFRAGLVGSSPPRRVPLQWM